MIPISTSMEDEYRAWLREKHPTSVNHYLCWVKSLARFVDGAPMAREDDVARWIAAQSAKSRRAARKGLRKYVSWAQSSGFVKAGAAALVVPRPAHGIPEEKAASIAKKRTGTLKERQVHALVTLYNAVPLPTTAVGKLRFENLVLSGDSPSVTWGGKLYLLAPHVVKSLQDWIRLRERLKTLPEERRRHRKTDEWAESDFVFPNPRGGASGYHSIWRHRRGVNKQEEPGESVALQASEE